MNKEITTATISMATIVMGTVLAAQIVRSQEALKSVRSEASETDKHQNRLDKLKQNHYQILAEKPSFDSTNLSTQKVEFSKVGLSGVFASERSLPNSKTKAIEIEKNPEKNQVSSPITIPNSISTPESIAIVPSKVEIKDTIAPIPEASTTQTIIPNIKKNQIQNSPEGVTTFGDSQSDNGHRYKVDKRIIHSPYSLEGRASNGYLWAEKISTLMQLQKSDENFAIGGEETYRIDKRVESYAQKKVENPGQQIYTLWGGTVDYHRGAGTPAPVIASIENSIKILKLAGAKTIIVPNLPNFTAAPQSSPLSQDSIIKAHNKALNTSLLESSKADRNVNIIPLDVRALSESIVANPNRFGLTTVTEACLTEAGVCSNPELYMVWDWIHPSAAMHSLIGDYAVSVLNAPQTIAPQINASLDLSKRAGQDVSDRLTVLRQGDSMPMGKLNVFALGSVQSGKQTDSVVGFDSNRRGFTTGADYRVSRNFTVGMAFTSAQGTTTLNDDRGKIVMNGSALSAYGSYRLGRFFTEGLVSYGWNQLETTRKVKVTGFNEANGTTGGQQVGAQVKAGYELGSKNWSVVPTIGISYSKANLNGYNERNADIVNLNVGAQASSTVALNTGMRLAYSFRSSLGTITPYVSANYSRDLTDGSREITTELATQAGIANRTRVNGGDRDVVRLGLGVNAQLMNALTLNVGYEKAMSQNSSDQSIQGRLNYSF